MASGKPLNCEPAADVYAAPQEPVSLLKLCHEEVGHDDIEPITRGTKKRAGKLVVSYTSLLQRLWLYINVIKNDAIEGTIQAITDVVPANLLSTWSSKFCFGMNLCEKMACLQRNDRVQQ